MSTFTNIDHPLCHRVEHVCFFGVSGMMVIFVNLSSRGGYVLYHVLVLALDLTYYPHTHTHIPSKKFFFPHLMFSKKIGQNQLSSRLQKKEEKKISMGIGCDYDYDYAPRSFSENIFCWWGWKGFGYGMSLKWMEDFMS